MPKVRYTGLSGIREVSKKDFTDNGVDDQGIIKVAGVNLHDLSRHKGVVREVEVSEAAATFLVDTVGEFEIVDEDAKASATTVDDDNDGGDNDDTWQPSGTPAT